MLHRSLFILGLALCAAGVARADVAPPPDAGHIADMASTQAKPDLSTTTKTDDGGCSMAAHGSSTSGAAGLIGLAAMGMLIASRRRRSL